MSAREPWPVAKVIDRAAELDNRTESGGCNVIVAADEFDSEDVERTDNGYTGRDAGTIGRLAATVRSVDTTDATLHYPDPDVLADGPWLVVAPLSGYLATVQCGIGRLNLRVRAEAGRSDRGINNRLTQLLETAQPSHPHYPVDDDEQGVFTTGLTTYSLANVTVDEGLLRVTFDMTTTPATRVADVREQFEEVAGVADVSVEPIVGVERADPSPGLRDAVEIAHRDVFGDACYDWISESTVFSRIPSGEKMALGIGGPDDPAFGAEEYDQCIDLLVECISNLGAAK